MDGVVSSFWKNISDPHSNATFIIAEAGVNHNGDLALAKKLIDAAKRAGADAVKFQTFQAERLTSAYAPKAGYQKKTTGSRGSQLAMLKKLQLTAQDHKILFDHCRKAGIMFLSTAFDEPSADLLEELGVEIFKIPSGELTNLALIKHIARKAKPLIISRGMADKNEIREALQVARSAKNDRLALLHCISSYPTDVKNVNLKAISKLKETFNVPVGFSDHTAQVTTSVYAVFAGARIIEKHITLDRSLPGPDQNFSLEPKELTQMVTMIRAAEISLGDGGIVAHPSEKDSAQIARKSLVAAQLIPAGTEVSEEMVAIKRPGTGIAPKNMALVLGRRTKAAIGKDQLITMDLLE
jgi:N-acetylneuraminate synthase